VNRFEMNGLRLSARFAYGEKNINAKFYDSESKFFMLKYPAISAEYTYSEKGLFDSPFNYQRLSIRADHQQKMNLHRQNLLLYQGGDPWRCLMAR
jgi:hypothetical protein